MSKNLLRNLDVNNLPSPMIKSLRNFIVAIILITGAKLIEVNFYHILKSPHPEDKEYKEKEGEKAEKTPNKDQLDEVIESTQKEEIDSTNQTSNVVEEPVVEDQVNESPDTNTDETSDSESNFESDNPQAASTTLTGDAYFQDLKNSYLSPIIASLPEGRTREDVVIRYYKHENDGNRAYILKELGYYLHEREAENNQRLASNSLYYGSDVDLRDIQIVAYTLLKEGMPLKAIKRSAYDWKFNSIEIGADSLVESNSILSVSDIQAFEIR